MKIEQHAVLNAVTRAIILCDSDPQEAQEGLYALGDYLKFYFAAASREASPATAQDLERVNESLDTLHMFLKGRPGAWARFELLWLRSLQVLKLWLGQYVQHAVLQ